jgi:hypothetical protein
MAQASWNRRAVQCVALCGAAALFLWLGSSCRCDESNARPPPAQDVLDAVVAALPRDPLRIEGELIVRKRHGVVLRSLKFAMDLRWGDHPSTARYTLRDAFGSDLEQLTVSRDDAGVATVSYAAGSPLKAAPVPDLYKPIQQTDIGWMDLALSFLWWKGGTIAGSEKILDRDCYVVDIPAPADAAPAQASALRYASVRVWIEKEARMLLQAEGLDEAHNTVRRLWVRSFKKFDDRWMIKDMEVQQFPGDHRTKLVIQDAGDVNAGTMPQGAEAP